MTPVPSAIADDRVGPEALIAELRNARRSYLFLFGLSLLGAVALALGLAP